MLANCVEPFAGHLKVLVLQETLGDLLELDDDKPPDKRRHHLLVGVLNYGLVVNQVDKTEIKFLTDMCFFL